ncbi:unnamed protein product [Rotaria socialis]
MTLAHSRVLNINIPANAKWAQNGVTIAGGNGAVDATNQLSYPQGLFVDDDQTVVIADYWNHRITQWKNGDTMNGQVVAGGKGQGNGLHQLDRPTDVLIDKETDSLIICDWGNRRVVRWSVVVVQHKRYIYISDYVKHEVRRYQLSEKNGTLVAGGNGKGNGLSQLNDPRYLFVDRQQNVYVSDNSNHHVMKWNKGAKEGIVVAGGQGRGNALTQLSHPNGIFVDTLGTLREQICQSQYEQETSEQEYEFLKQQIAYYNLPSQSFESSTISHHPIIDSIQNLSAQEALMKQFKEVAIQSRITLFNIYLKSAEDQREEYKKKHEANIKKMDASQHALNQNEKLSSTFVELINERCNKISDRIQCIYKHKRETFQSKSN